MTGVHWITQRRANAYIIQNHRHHDPVVGSITQIGWFVSGELVGIAVIGRPVSRMIDHQIICEVTRLCTEGYRNACSKLYAACARIAKEMGFHKIITYILESESGVSLKAAGWVCEGLAGGKSWNVPSRPRQQVRVTLFETIEKYPMERKVRWSKLLSQPKEQSGREPDANETKSE
jgi:hypothetical protein